MESEHDVNQDLRNSGNQQFKEIQKEEEYMRDNLSTMSQTTGETESYYQ
jgi:hypothetical protein